MAEMDVKTLITRLQRMHGHVGARDKTTLVAAIGALTDISVQLFSATHPNYRPQKGKGGFELRQVANEEPGESGGVGVGVSDGEADGAAALPLP